MEEQIIKELGSPEKVALMIREGITGEEQVERSQRMDFFRAGTTTERFRQTTRGSGNRGKRSSYRQIRDGQPETGNRGPAGH